MKILLIMLVVVVGMKVFAHDNEITLKPWDRNTDSISLKPWDRDTNTNSVTEKFVNRRIQMDYEKRMSDLEYELEKLKEKERMENIRPVFFNKPYIPAR